ncbi:hypothetical protein ACFV3N_16710 [Streptomyces bauhiniae]|uniref:hypothetical protein n=1 Tax=Streptomyces bauhiniae TaxID=2340725 RepID=UPI00365A5602
MRERDEALDQAMERASLRMGEVIRRHLVIRPEPSPLPPPDDPLYDLHGAQRRVIADLRARKCGRKPQHHGRDGPEEG